MAPDATGNLGSPGLRGLLPQPHLECSEGGALLVRSAPWRLDRILIEVGYAGGLRVSELVALTWSDVIERAGGRVQLSVLGKGHKRREVLLPEVVSRSLLSLRGDAGANDPVFASPRGGHLTERAVNYPAKCSHKD